MIKARDRDVATANRKAEEATSRALEMEKRLGLLGWRIGRDSAKVESGERCVESGVR